MLRNKWFKEYKPPVRPEEIYTTTVFLGGSIDMGHAEDWQAKLTNELRQLPVEIFNPRRDDWDSSWEQDISNPQFNEQVNWELDLIEEADLVAMYFDPNGKSPITLLELGLCAGKDKSVIVYCPPGFWRRGNVQIMCERHNFTLVESWDEFVAEIKDFIQID